MLNFLSEQFGNDYKIVLVEDDKQVVRIYRSIGIEQNMTDPEIYVELNRKNDDENWDLILGEKDKRYLIKRYRNEAIGMVSLYIYAVNKLGDDIGNNETRMKLIDLNEGDTLAASEIIGEEISDNYFSLTNNKVKGAVNLEPMQKDNQYNIYYQSYSSKRLNIINNREAPSAYLVLYNYALLLQYFDDLLIKWESNNEITVLQREELKLLFIGK